MRVEALAFKCGKIMVPAVRYGDVWFVPLLSLARSLGLSPAIERRRVGRLPSWWPVTAVDVAYGYARGMQPCLRLDRVPSYLAAVAVGCRAPRRAMIETVLLGWSDAVDGFLFEHDARYAASAGLQIGNDITQLLVRVSDEARTQERRLARSIAASHAQSGRRIAVEQFRRIKELKAAGETHTQIARTVGVSLPTVSLVVHGKYKYPPDIAALI